MTSFKAATLLKDNPDIEKCLFVVDRKISIGTREEFNKFQEGCVEENTNTETLVRRMLSEDYTDKVIVTTIQKLGLALDPDHRKNYKDRLEPLNKNGWFSFLMNAIDLSLEITTMLSKNFLSMHNCLVLRAPLYLKRMLTISKMARLAR